MDLAILILPLLLFVAITIGVIVFQRKNTRLANKGIESYERLIESNNRLIEAINSLTGIMTKK